VLLLAVVTAITVLDIAALSLRITRAERRNHADRRQRPR